MVEAPWNTAASRHVPRRAADMAILAAVERAKNLPVPDIAAELDKLAKRTVVDQPMRIYRLVLLERWCKHSPAEVVRYAFARANKEVLRETTALWIRTDPAGAYAFLGDHRRIHPWFAQDCMNGASDALERWAKSDPKAALATFARDRMDIYSTACLIDFARYIPAELESAARSWPEPLAKEARRKLQHERARADFPAALARMLAAPDGLAQLRELVSGDFTIARLLGPRLQMLPPAWQKDLLADSLSGSYIICENPELWLHGMWAHVELTEERKRSLDDSAVYAMLNRQSGSLDPLLVTARTWQPDARAALLSNLAYSSSTDAVARTLAWVDTLEDAEERTRLLEKMASIREMESRIEQTTAANAASRVMLADRWADEVHWRQAGAADVLAALPEFWDCDRGRAGRWVAGLPAGPARDKAMESLVHNWAWDHPAGALHWLHGLPAPDQQRWMPVAQSMVP